MDRGLFDEFFIEGEDLEVSCNVFSFRFPFLIIQYASSRRLSEGEDLDFDEIDG